MINNLTRRVRVLEELIKARLEVDVMGLVAGVRARLESRLDLDPLPVSADMAERVGPFGWGRVRTTAWQAPRYRKIVLSHVAMPPIVEGFALVTLPQPTVAAPIFACDLMALPTRISLNADLYGTAELRDEVNLRLAPVREHFARLDSRQGPLWTSAIGSGSGLHAKVSPRVIDDAFAALNATLGISLDLVADAPKEPSQSGVDLQRKFFTAFHEHGPRRGPLGVLFGRVWADRYSRLLFG